MPEGYGAPPDLDPAKPNVFAADLYLRGVKSDLEEIEFKRKDAEDKIRAVSRPIIYPDGQIEIPSTSQPLFLRLAKTNFKRRGLDDYPEFPPCRCDVPAPMSGDYLEREMHKLEILNFRATADAYIADAYQFIRNCDNDIETIKKAKQKLVSDLWKLRAAGVDVFIPIE